MCSKPCLCLERGEALIFSSSSSSSFLLSFFLSFFFFFFFFFWSLTEDFVAKYFIYL
jgi:hypothetical protein